MQKDGNHDAGPSALPGSPSDSDHRHASSSGFPPSAKLREKLEKLANRRLDLSSIEFVNDAPEFHGGYATVSRALLVSTSSYRDSTTKSNPTKKDCQCFDVPGPAGEASRQRKVGAALPFRAIGSGDERLINLTLQDVAVKKMETSDDPARVLGLTLREAEFLVGISHKNVIKLEGFVEDLSKDVVWLVFPWAENGNLKDFIASAEWEIPERTSLIYDVAKGVEYLHSRQPPIRHGDLKSPNLLVNSEYRVVITDFGSARRQPTEDLDETNQAERKPQPALSLEPAFCGATNTMTLTLKADNFTLRWAAPELLYQKKATVASDIWALGCVIYEVMTNSIPFQDVNVDTAVVIRVIKGDLPSITNEARMALIKALCSLVLACWSKDPLKRPTAENCRKSISWMPRIRPSQIPTTDAAAARARTPALLIKLGAMYMRQDDYANASQFFNKALDSYREVGDGKGRAAALIELAQVHRFQDENNLAITSYSEALDICTDIGDMQGRAEALFGLAEVHRFRDEYSQAITSYSAALQIYTDIGNRRGRAAALFGLAEVHKVRNEYSQAITFYSEALDIRTDIGDRQGRASALWGLAEVHKARNEYTQAVTFYSEVLQIRADIGDRQGRAIALSSLADVHRLRNEYSQAVKFYIEALQIRTDIGDRQGRSDSLWGLAEVHRLQKQYSQAIQLFSEALQIDIDIGDRDGRAWTLMCLADVHRDQDQFKDAMRLYEQAAAAFGEIGRTGEAEEALYRTAEARQQLEPTQ